MKSRHLAEAIILQCIEDLWDEDYRKDSINFFTGDDFRTCASIAGIEISAQLKILYKLSSLIKDIHKPRNVKHNTLRRCLLQPERWLSIMT
jgi:hypothetical protein